jgi:hypothetical protein
MEFHWVARAGEIFFTIRCRPAQQHGIREYPWVKLIYTKAFGAVRRSGGGDRFDNRALTVADQQADIFGLLVA